MKKQLLALAALVVLGSTLIPQSITSLSNLEAKLVKLQKYIEHTDFAHRTPAEAKDIEADLKGAVASVLNDVRLLNIMA